MTKQPPEVAALIPAAGRGTRMGGRRKQYRHLGDEPLLARTLWLFDERPRVSSIVVAVAPEDLSRMEDEIATYSLSKLHRVVAGGMNRQESVAAAFGAVPKSTEIVLVHDAVRPFLPPDRIDAVIDAVEEHGAAALAIPVNDTIRRGNKETFGETVRRDGLLRMQTPQGFRADWLAEAHASARRDDVLTTDEVALVERLGKSVRIVRGSPLNFKVTTPEDWLLAQAVWHRLTATS